MTDKTKRGIFLRDVKTALEAYASQPTDGSDGNSLAAFIVGAKLRGAVRPDASQSKEPLTKTEGVTYRDVPRV